VIVPYVPVNDEPTVPDVPEPSVLPVRISVIVNTASGSRSVSLFSTKSPEPLATVNVASSLTLPVSLAATGASLIPVTVMVKRAVSVCDPLVTV